MRENGGISKVGHDDVYFLTVSDMFVRVQVNGVDVSPIVWVAILSLANETLLGPQGILVILAKKAAS